MVLDFTLIKYDRVRNTNGLDGGIMNRYVGISMLYRISDLFEDIDELFEDIDDMEGPEEEEDVEETEEFDDTFELEDTDELEDVE